MRFFKKGGVIAPHTKARAPKEKHKNYTPKTLKSSLQKHATRPNGGSLAQ